MTCATLTPGKKKIELKSLKSESTKSKQRTQRESIWTKDTFQEPSFLDNYVHSTNKPQYSYIESESIESVSPQYMLASNTQSANTSVSMWQPVEQMLHATTSSKPKTPYAQTKPVDQTTVENESYDREKQMLDKNKSYDNYGDINYDAGSEDTLTASLENPIVYNAKFRSCKKLTYDDHKVILVVCFALFYSFIIY